MHRDYFPVDVNRADRDQLLRIPGIGARSVGRILKTRRYRALAISDLQKLRVAWKRAAPFVVTADHNPALRLLDGLHLKTQLRVRSKQLLLFEAATSAVVGEL